MVWQNTLWKRKKTISSARLHIKPYKKCTKTLPKLRFHSTVFRSNGSTQLVKLHNLHILHSFDEVRCVEFPNSNILNSKIYSRFRREWHMVTLKQFLYTLKTSYVTKDLFDRFSFLMLLIHLIWFTKILITTLIGVDFLNLLLTSSLPYSYVKST